MAEQIPPCADPTSSYATHEVTNQPSELTGYNAFRDDRALTQAIEVMGGGWYQAELAAFGAQVGTARVQVLARQANRHPPELISHDRFGRRIDEIEFHPAWHELMTMARASGTHSLCWEPRHRGRQGLHVARAGLSFLLNQAENGICCPITMTFAAHAALRHQPDLLQTYAPALYHNSHDPRPLPAAQKSALTMAMAMTEKQGGSDLRQIQTKAQKSGQIWLLTGHKWFFSVPQSDLFLTLARSEKGISCFLAPGWLADGSRNRLILQRLKDKCGNRSNASAEVEFRGLEAQLVGEEGRGIATILEMAHLTRLDCAISAGAIMRQSLRQAIHHCRQRHAFQRALIDQPLMESVLADLALDSEAFLWSGLRLAQTQDDGEAGALLGRIAIPMGKYLACKRAPAFVAETLECHGGNGYIEDHMMARLYREAPLNGVWEGSGNVICLDVLRAAQTSPKSLELWHDEVALACGGSRDFDRALQDIEGVLRDLGSAQGRARFVVERMARLFQASLLLRHAPSMLAEAFCRQRLGRHSGQDYGAVLGVSNARQIIDRAGILESG